jgi:hypothetical protein
LLGLSNVLVWKVDGLRLRVKQIMMTILTFLLVINIMERSKEADVRLTSEKEGGKCRERRKGTSYRFRDKEEKEHLCCNIV